MTTEDHDATVYQFTPPPPTPAATAAELGQSSAPGERPGAANPAGHSRKGGPQKARRRARVTKTAAGLALVLGTGAGAGAVVTATSSGGAVSLASTSAASSRTKPAPSRSGRNFFWGMRSPHGFGMRFGVPFLAYPGALPGNLVHGTYTVKGPSGSYETLDTQVGIVQAVSSSSITVKSTDGYSKQYVVGSSTVVYADSNGIGSVKAGDQVSVIGLAGSSGVTAERIVDITQVKANGGRWQPAPPTPPTSGSNGGTTTSYSNGHPFGGDDPGPAA